MTLHDYINIREDELPNTVYPLRMALLSAEQQKDKQLQERVRKHRH